MGVFQTRNRVGPRKIAVFVAVGFLIGSILGYIFMATVHAVRLKSQCLQCLTDESCLPNVISNNGSRFMTFDEPCHLQMLEIKAESHWTESGQSAPVTAGMWCRC